MSVHGRLPNAKAGCDLLLAAAFENTRKYLALTVRKTRGDGNVVWRWARNLVLSTRLFGCAQARTHRTHPGLIGNCGVLLHHGSEPSHERQELHRARTAQCSQKLVAGNGFAVKERRQVLEVRNCLCSSARGLAVASRHRYPGGSEIGPASGILARKAQPFKGRVCRCALFPRASWLEQPAVHGDHLGGDVARAVRPEKDDQRRDFLRRAKPPERDFVGQPVALLRGVGVR